MFEFLIHDDYYCAKKRIQDLKFSTDVVITSITRNGKILPPRGAIELQPGDILFILAPLSRQHALKTFLREGSDPIEEP